jgi:hypothetical protein
LSGFKERQWLMRGGWVNVAADELAEGGDHRDLALKALKATNRLDQIIEQLKHVIPDYEHPRVEYGVEYVSPPDELRRTPRPRDDDDVPRPRRPARSGNGRARVHKGNKRKATAANATGADHG